METVVERDNVGKKKYFNAKTKPGLQTVEPGKGLKSQARVQIYIFHWWEKKSDIAFSPFSLVLSIDVEIIQLQSLMSFPVKKK